MRGKAAESPRKGHLVLWLALCLLELAPSAALADNDALVRNSFGDAGIIEMPSARMAPDGEFSASASFFKNTQHYNFGFQILPWLETSFRYSALQHFDPTFPVYYDRSFAIKARLWQEGALLPTISLGINDLIGTGIYSGEYLVASKRIGPLDFSLGVGWGRLGSTALFKNPFASIFSSFENRPTFTSPGGTNFNVFFHGPNSGLFGGVTWQTPIEKLSLTAEYSSDTYVLESERGNFRPINQMNYGASYRVADGIVVGLNWLYGRSVSGNISFQLDPTTDPYPRRIGPPLPPPPPIRSPEHQQEALNLLLSRNGRSAPPSHGFSTSRALVDELWLNDSGLSDIIIHGHVMMLLTSGRDLKAVCSEAAQTIGVYSVTIKGVSVSNGDRHFNCPVTTSPALALLTPGLRDEFSAPPLSSLAIPAGLITIDASAESLPDANAAIARIRNDARQQRIIIQAISFSAAEAIVYYSNINYFSEVAALERLTRVLMTDGPREIEKFRLIETLGGVPQREFDLLRAPAERSFAQTAKLDFASNMTAAPASMQNAVLNAGVRGTYPRFSWEIFPQFRQQLFDPTNPFGVQFLAAASGTIELLPGLSMMGEAEASIWDTFDVRRAADSDLPHVRTDFLKYFTEGKNGIGALETAYRFRLSPNIFATIKAGYLESMFAGMGAEVLWRPEGQRWALGGDIYEVQKRNFDRLFGLQSYRVLTGHVSLYYASPWYNLDFQLRAGRYLAGDRGITFVATRHFSTGVEIGAFFTKTNVSAARFGEGSFDKGIILRIPLGWTAPIDTQSQLNMEIRPIQRDGGQILAGDATLFDETERSSESEIARQMQNLAFPN